MERLDNLGWSPTRFEQLVAGTDFRVYVLPEEICATEIRSKPTTIPYPAESTSPESRVAQLPEDVAARCRRVVRELGLAFEGIDLWPSPRRRVVLL